MTEYDRQQEEEGYRILLPRRQAFPAAHCTVEITPQVLRVREAFGPFNWGWEQAWDRNTEFSVGLSGHGARSDGPFGILAEFEHGTRSFAAGYPQPKLEELAAQLNAAQQEWRDRPRQSPGALESHAPMGTEIQYHKTAQGLRVEVPPAGLVKGSHGLWVMGLIFTGLPVLAGIGGIARLIQGGGVGETLVVGLMLSLFLLVGSIMLASAWNMGKRTAILELDAENLYVDRRSIFGKRHMTFARKTVTDVKCASSGMVVNGKAVMELQIFAHGRKAIGMLSQREDAELQRLAAKLMATLCEPVEGADEGTDQSPPPIHLVED